MYKMRIYHRNAVKKDEKTKELILDRNIIESAFNTSVGHSIVELANNGESIARGLYPSNLYKDETETIQNSKEYQEKHPDEKVFHVMEIDISEAQYQKAMQYMEKFEPYVDKNIPKEVLGGIYQFIGYNCSDFSNSVYKAAGLPCNFTYQYTTEELNKIPGAVELYVDTFGVGDKPYKILSDLTLEEFAAEWNVPLSSLSVVENTGAVVKPSSLVHQNPPKHIYTIFPNPKLPPSTITCDEHLNILGGNKAINEHLLQAAMASNDPSFLEDIESKIKTSQQQMQEIEGGLANAMHLMQTNIFPLSQEQRQQAANDVNDVFRAIRQNPYVRGEAAFDFNPQELFPEPDNEMKQWVEELTRSSEEMLNNMGFGSNVSGQPSGAGLSGNHFDFPLD